MLKPLWQKADSAIDEKLMRFMAGEDVTLDRQLFIYDIAASHAHALGLHDIGVLSDAELDGIATQLTALEAAFKSGEFVLDARFEDGHSAIEAWLTEHLGQTGEKIHTGRSRNDQVLVATRLFLREATYRLHGLCCEIAERCLVRAEHAGNQPMPGYTHLQRAVVSSVDCWFACFAESFIDNAVLAWQTTQWCNANPLGTAAGYGVNLPLNRTLTSKVLGFDRLQLNPLYAQNSRGKFELQALYALSQAMGDVRRMAWDLSLFTSQEMGFVSLPSHFTTGSSIMPNKRNPDPVELLRGAYAVTHGAINELQSVLSLPSGYQRDLQGTKPPMLRGLNHGLDALAVVVDLVDAIEFSPTALEAAIEPSMYTTDLAVELTAQGLPFRQAYRQAAEQVDSLSTRDPRQSVAARVSPGAAGDLRLDLLRQRLSATTAA